MVSFILVTQNKTERQAYIQNYAMKNQISPFDITVLDRETTIKPNSLSIGISDVVKLQEKIFLKPIKSKTKLIVLEDAQLLTIEAQNALLKILEEPPNHTDIFLATDSIDSLLPTILSRCQVIKIDTQTDSLTLDKKMAYEEFIRSFPTLKIGDKLKKAERLAKNKADALNWLTECIFVLHDKIISKEGEDTMSILLIKRLTRLHTLLKTTNVNLRLAIETAFIEKD